MQVISVLGRKGGTGKTLVSHMIAYGLGNAGYPVVLIQTDVRTAVPPQHIKGRPYWTFGIQGPPDEASDQAAEIMTMTNRIPSSVLVLDGGANRRNVDYWISAHSRLVLVPVAPGSEDIAVARNDYEELGAHMRRENPEGLMAYVLNRWPGDARRQKALLGKSWIGPFLEESRETRLDYFIPDMQSTMDIGFDLAPSAPIPVRLAARKLRSALIDVLELPAPPNEPTVEEDVEAAMENGEGREADPTSRAFSRESNAAE